MRKSSKILLALFLVMVTISISATYQKYFVLDDFEVEFEIDCDIESENCFVWICDPEIDGEDYCTGDPEDDIWYYKYFYRNASDLPNCDLDDEDCPVFECSESEECYEITCSEENLEEFGLDGQCVGPIY